MYYALSLDYIVTNLGRFLLEFPTLLKLMTYGVFWFEVIGPLLVISPFITYQTRIVGIYGLPRSWFERRLKTVRDWVFLVGADLISQGRRVQIRFAIPEVDRAEFLRRLSTVSEGLPIAAQLEWTLTDQTPTRPDNIVTPIALLSSHSTVDQSP